ncbi:hypothetical protein BC629DRAFT_1581510 [Irpex lacteus]|nr:hypothetical protein BC629DRAFT_1581510 [Irpex lacteus]
MPPKRAKCQICNTNESKYTCATCMIVYCSVPCFKSHKEGAKPRKEAEIEIEEAAPPLRSLTSLKWPYIPEESAYPDPLKRDDPKQLQLHQYESIATSLAVRKALASNPKLPDLLRSIDRLRGADREEALQRALGVSPADLDLDGTPGAGRRVRVYEEEEVGAMRELAEAVEAAVRGGKEDVLGLNWGD